MPHSAVDSISPAIEQTKRQLFQPFRFGHWTRLALVSVLTGEFAGNSGGNGASTFNIPIHSGRGRTSSDLVSLPGPFDQFIEQFLVWILVGIVAMIVFGLLWMYIASVYRFILLDTVLSNRCELRKGWNRWQEQGSSLFLWGIGFGLAMAAALAVFLGGPVYLAWRAGLFRRPDDHLVHLIISGAALFLLALGLVVLGLLVSLFTKDFVVPVMALENLGVIDAWRRLLPMLRGEKLAYALYVLMKIVLAIASAVLFGIVGSMVILGLLLPAAVLGFALVVFWKAASLSWNAYTISAAVLLGVGGIAGVVYAIAFVSAPAVVFFQSYALQFFGSRYLLLGAQLAPAPPTEPTPAPL